MGGSYFVVLSSGLRRLEPKTSFWDLFEVAQGHDGEGFFRRAAQQNAEFSMTVFLRADSAAARNRSSVGSATSAASSPLQQRSFVMTFR